VAFGDLISGPLGPVFGPGIIDVNLRKIQGQSWRFTHTHYWSLPDGKRDTVPKHIKQLRKALDLGGAARATVTAAGHGSNSSGRSSKP
jgi:hypothetical protein